jgi:WD40 repeat protein
MRFRHGGTVLSVAFSPDRKTVASGGADNAVRVWEVATGKELRRFTAATGPGAELALVHSIAFSPDGKLLVAATGNPSRELVMWRPATGEEVWHFRDNPREMTSLAFSPDGKSLAAGDTAGSVRLWDVGSGEPRCELKGQFFGVKSIAFSPKGEILASACIDRTIRLWDLSSGRELRQLKGHNMDVLAVAFARDGKTLASGSFDRTIRLWDPATGKELRVLKHSDPVSTLAFFPDGKTLASGGWDYCIRLWDTATGKELRQMQGHQGVIESIALSPDGKTLASGSWDRTVRLWDPANGREIRPTPGHHHSLWSVSISPDGKQVASGDEVGGVRLWESATGKEIRLLSGRLPDSPINLVDRLSFSPDGETLRAASWSSKLSRWETATGKPLGERIYKGISPILTADGKLVVSSNSGDGMVFVQEAVTARPVREFTTQKQSYPDQLNHVAVSPDGKYLAGGSPRQDGTVVIWELATGVERCRCKAALDWVGYLAFSPDGRYLAGTTMRRGYFTPQSPIHLWDAATGRELRLFEARGHSVTCLSFSPDGRNLASGAGDRTVRLWEVATGKERRRFAGHQGVIRSVALSGDGMLLASASDDTTALVWDATGAAAVEELSAGQLRDLWNDLVGDDGAKAYRAIWRLARNPKCCVPFLREKLQPARALPPDERKQIQRCLADLDSDDAAVREHADAELAKTLVTVEPLLRQALTGRPSLEQRKRIERLLERLEGEQVTLSRVLEAAEHANTPETWRLLEEIAAGEPDSWLTREAKASLHRRPSRRDK